jgi:predicted RNA-binding Zn ribbon-like protein
MADAIPLDPRGYQGTYKLIGGRPALDFANLVSYRGSDRHHDWLDPPGNAAVWAEAAGMTAFQSLDVAALREFRELLARTFLAIVDGTSPAPGDVDGIGKAAVIGWTHRSLSFAAGAPAAVWATTATPLLNELALDAASLLTSAASLRRVAACPECRWLFLDTTRNHSRQWCDPADCGNRARQRRHYRRQR